MTLVTDKHTPLRLKQAILRYFNLTDLREVASYSRESILS